MFARNEQILNDLAQLTAGKKCALAVGHIAANPNGMGRAAQNCVTVLESGQRVFKQAKTLLPAYDIFDELRYFEPAEEVRIWPFEGRKIAVAICEDLWAEDRVAGRLRYNQSPVQAYAAAQADVILSLSSSPYEMGKSHRREDLHRKIAQELNAAIVYVNQTGASDEVLFDGGSFVLDNKGKKIGQMPFFKKSLGLVDLTNHQFEIAESKTTEYQTLPKEIDSNDWDILARGLITGIREYFTRTGFTKAILGLSGGLDSAVVATLACQALGPKNVLGVAMPSQYSSQHSLADAERLAYNLRMRFEVHPIKFLFATASRELAEGRGTLEPIALENLQSRLRGLTLMTLANHESSLALSCGNKSEIAMGYCTLYGDTIGALSAIGDVYKTQVYTLANYLNQALGNVIPQSTLTKSPSAELKPGQVDQDSLPPYDLLDPILREYIEECQPVETIVATHIAKVPRVREFLAKIERNEFKRRQSPFILKVSPRAFGTGRRIPIAQRWKV